MLPGILAEAPWYPWPLKLYGCGQLFRSAGARPCSLAGNPFWTTNGTSPLKPWPLKLLRLRPTLSKCGGLATALYSPALPAAPYTNFAGSTPKGSRACIPG